MKRRTNYSYRQRRNRPRGRNYIQTPNSSFSSFQPQNGFEKEKHLFQNPNFRFINEPFSKKDRVLHPNAPRKKYYSRKKRGEKISVNHWGQRKLLLSEIEFLTLYGKENCTVIYAGAAPGTHTNYLSLLFPSYNFILVDPADFICQPSKRIEIIQGYFTDELAMKYSKLDGHVLFLSDIRAANHEVMSFQENEKQIITDMNLQRKWVELMKPSFSMLKFRLPYFSEKEMAHTDSSTFEYLDGDIFLPVWGRQSTTECRLICDGSCKLRLYGIKEYEE